VRFERFGFEIGFGIEIEIGFRIEIDIEFEMISMSFSMMGQWAKTGCTFI
jgi:hypothetical protein